MAPFSNRALQSQTLFVFPLKLNLAWRPSNWLKNEAAFRVGMLVVFTPGTVKVESGHGASEPSPLSQPL